MSAAGRPRFTDAFSALLVIMLLTSCTSTASNSTVTGSPAETPALNTQPLTAVACSSNGSTHTVWTALKKTRQVTGLLPLPLRAGQKYSGVPQVKSVATYTAEVTSSSKLDPKFQATILKKFESKLNIGPHDLGDSTQGIAPDHGKVSIAASSSKRRYVFYTGIRQRTGTWKWHACRTGSTNPNTFWSPWITGNSASWDGEVSGTLLCGDKQNDSQFISVAVQKLGC